MKLDHEAAQRTWRMAEKRLLQLGRDHAARCEELAAQVPPYLTIYLGLSRPLSRPYLGPYLGPYLHLI